MIEPRGRGVLDHPHARVMTASMRRLCCHFQTWLRLLAAPFARGLHRPCPSLRTEGAGKTGCALHPRSRVQNCAKKRTRAYRFSGGIRPSLRNGFTVYNVLSPATNSICHRHRRIEVLRGPVGLVKPPPIWHQQRVPGPHDFAVRSPSSKNASPEGAPPPKFSRRRI